MRPGFIAAVVGALSLVAATAEAGDYRDQPNLFFLMGGLSFTDGGDFEKQVDGMREAMDGTGLRLEAADHGLQGAVRWDRRVGRAVAFGLEGQLDRISSSDSVVETGTLLEARVTGTALSMFGNVTLLPLGTPSFYLGGGAGATWARVKESLGDETPDLIEVTLSAWAPSFQGFVGLTVPVTSNGFLGIQGSYRVRRIDMDEGMLRIAGDDWNTLDFSHDPFRFDLSGPAALVVLGGQF